MNSGGGSDSGQQISKGYIFKFLGHPGARKGQFFFHNAIKMSFSPNISDMDHHAQQILQLS